MATAYPQLSQHFGFLTGFAYTLPFAFCGLFFGKIVPKVNRKFMLGICMALTAATMGVAGFVDSFAALAASRFVLGAVSSAFNPLSFSLLTEYFPPEKRATANSILQSGNYIGWGLSSISILLIKSFGWRSTFGILGGIALSVGIACILFVKEPAAKISQAVAQA
mmetsp:Transcript_8896/g.15092  ORF Transcript_8896/g.15092 Transcript_8896/m.15092 type:complete len:165 (+) Transcript_8896:936-1430(+)